MDRAAPKEQRRAGVIPTFPDSRPGDGASDHPVLRAYVRGRCPPLAVRARRAGAKPASAFFGACRSVRIRDRERGPARTGLACFHRRKCLKAKPFRVTFERLFCTYAR